MAAGHPPVADHNRPGALGVGPLPRNVRDGTRMSTALTYLAPARPRPNLELRPDTLVDRRPDHGRARGVQLTPENRSEADGVVLAAGAYGSPAILLRSGVGPAEHLRRSICRSSRTSRGRREPVDHPLVSVDLPATPGPGGPAFRCCSRCAPPSPPPPTPRPAPVPRRTVQRPLAPQRCRAGIVTGLLSPRSRGSLRLRSADPAEPPRSTRPTCAIPTTCEDGRGHPGSAPDQPDHAAGRPGARTRDRTRPPGVSDGVGLARSICRRVAPYHHPVGTCAMGPDPDAGAVVTARGAVHGIDRLWVADASVMPTIPAANTNLPTIVVAERIASWLDTG